MYVGSGPRTLTLLGRGKKLAKVYAIRHLGIIVGVSSLCVSPFLGCDWLRERLRPQTSSFMGWDGRNGQSFVRIRFPSFLSNIYVYSACSALDFLNSRVYGSRSAFGRAMVCLRNGHL